MRLIVGLGYDGSDNRPDFESFDVASGESCGSPPPPLSGDLSSRF